MSEEIKINPEDVLKGNITENQQIIIEDGTASTLGFTRTVENIKPEEIKK